MTDGPAFYPYKYQGKNESQAALREQMIHRFIVEMKQVNRRETGLLALTGILAWKGSTKRKYDIYL